ncbi:M16 family metallopeptidase, partial [Lactobacillus nasalidis]
IIVDFGSSDPQPLPGLAHFLEHKLFAAESGDLSLEFEKMGADVNAFTSFNETMYYCSGVKNVAPMLDLLFKLVGEPYFTDENVQKEIPIIQQELAMYQDEPDWILGDKLLRGSYGDSNLAIDVAGTKESIASVTKETLLAAYRENYVAERMSFVACGDFSDNQVKTILRQAKKLSEQYFASGTKQKDSDLLPVLSQGEDWLLPGQEVPLLAVELLLPNFKKVLASRDMAQILLEIMLESKLGAMSSWFARMRQDQLLSQPLQISVTYTRQGAYAVLFGMSPDGAAVIDRIKAELEPGQLFSPQKQAEMNQLFEIQKRSWLAQTVRGLDNLSGFAVEMAEESLDGEDLFANVERMQALSFADYQAYCQDLLSGAGINSVRAGEEDEQ